MKEEVKNLREYGRDKRGVEEGEKRVEIMKVKSHSKFSNKLKHGELPISY